MMSITINQSINLSLSLSQAVNLEGVRCPQGVTDDEMRAFCENLAPSLSRLNVSHCCGLTDAFLLSFARSATAVETLNADGIPWISGGCDFMHLCVAASPKTPTTTTITKTM